MLALFLAALLVAPGQDVATRPSFAEWLMGLRAEAIARGIRAEVVDEALAGVEQPEPTVIQRDRAQAEAVLSLEKYITRILKPKFVQTGQTQFKEQRQLLDQVSERYGVSPRIIVAVWGLESN